VILLQSSSSQAIVIVLEFVTLGDEFALNCEAKLFNDDDPTEDY
jgi:hypothetical protein